jgi:hypothetical protein
MPFYVEFFPGNRNRFRPAIVCDAPNCARMFGADTGAEPYVIYGVPTDEKESLVRPLVACSAACRDVVMAEVVGDRLGMASWGMAMSEARSMPFAEYWAGLAATVGISE